uniref:hypothetical protein n=1 Tax=Pseudomonas sp. GLE121 TaxID=1329969 RepID=UPI0015642904|nr:hypothetical protein [Pseudomonas sp. GLE121]
MYEQTQDLLPLKNPREIENMLFADVFAVTLALGKPSCRTVRRSLTTGGKQAYLQKSQNLGNALQTSPPLGG